MCRDQQLLTIKSCCNYFVLIVVEPFPTFPVVEGCSHQQYCVLEKQVKDILRCTVLGIRPEIQLEWRTFRDDSPITFTQQQLTVTQNGDLFDVTLTTGFDLSSTSHDKLTVECRTVGKNAELFNLSTKLDILLVNGKCGDVYCISQISHYPSFNRSDSFIPVLSSFSF